MADDQYSKQLAEELGFSLNEAMSDIGTRCARYLWGKAVSLLKEKADLSKRLGKPRCLDCNSAGMMNCSHFDNCNGRWKYALETRAESAESSLRVMREALINLSSAAEVYEQSHMPECGCQLCEALKASDAALASEGKL